MNPHAHLLMGIEEFAKANFDESARHFMRLQDPAPTLAVAQLISQEIVLDNIGYCYYRMHNIGEALKFFNLATQTNPAYAPAWDHIGQIFTEMRLFGKAIMPYEMLVKYANHPKYPDQSMQCALDYKETLEPAHNLRKLGYIVGDQGNYARAIEIFEQALLINPRDTKCMVEMGWNCLQIKNYSRAQSVLQEALAINPNLEQAQTLLRSAMDH